LVFSPALDDVSHFVTAILLLTEVFLEAYQKLGEVLAYTQKEETACLLRVDVLVKAVPHKNEIVLDLDENYQSGKIS
jgi:hypothetical protein